jgi:hypothetical protein
LNPDFELGKAVTVGAQRRIIVDTTREIAEMRRW